MKRVLIAIVALVISLSTASAQRLTNISVEAQYITDKMALELGLSSYQRNSILQLNLNYLNGITSYRDINSKIWKQRNRSLKALLNSTQWALYQNAAYFYRPIGWKDGAYVHNIYARYPQRHYDCKFPPPPHKKGNKEFKKHGPGKHGPGKHDFGGPDRRDFGGPDKRNFGSRR